MLLDDGEIFDYFEQNMFLTLKSLNSNFNENIIKRRFTNDVFLGEGRSKSLWFVWDKRRRTKTNDVRCLGGGVRPLHTNVARRPL
jgi:hypothetical protein